MNGEVGYIVSVRSMREYVLRRDEAAGPVPGGDGAAGAPPGTGVPVPPPAEMIPLTFPS